jgi:hypothetical protein
MHFGCVKAKVYSRGPPSEVFDPYVDDAFTSRLIHRRDSELIYCFGCPSVCVAPAPVTVEFLLIVVVRILAEERVSKFDQFFTS